MEEIIIIGCGQHANVVLYNIKCQNKYKALGFFDSDNSKVGKNFYGLSVLECYEDGMIDKLVYKYKTNKFFVGFGTMKYRRMVYDKFVNAGWNSVNIIHPNAVVSDNAQLGKGILIESGCLITPNPVIGNNVVVNTGSQINHDNIVENHVYIASGVILSGGVRIEENTLIDDGVIVTLGRKVGSNCIIGAGSVVTKDVENNVIAYGNPAKAIKKNDVF